MIYLINSGHYKPGDQLPTVRGLAAEISINFNTVNKAYLSMASDGYITSTRGRGVFVNDLDSEDDEDKAIETVLEDCIDACLEMGLSHDDIGKRMMKKLRRIEKEKSRK